MKKLRTLLITAVLVALASSAFAAGTATLTINANVLGTCSFTTAGATMGFLSLDPTATTAATASTSIVYNCTSGVAYTFTNAASTNIFNGLNSMKVDLAYTDANLTGIGTGTATTLTIDGTITVASFTGAVAGAYTGTAALNINP